MYAFSYAHTGTKNVAKEIKKIATGTAKTEGQKWFGELSDKRMFILYYTIYMYVLYVYNYRKKYQGPPVLLYEELFYVT